jgi:hypothetical protein
MSINNSDMPIAPHEQLHGSGGTLVTSGLTKREHFAGLAMQGILASQYVSNFCKEDQVCPASVSKAAVNYAEALLRELDK